MRHLRIALAAAALTATLGVASPASAATPAQHGAIIHNGAAITGGDWGRHRRHHFGRFGRFGFPIVTPFVFGGGFDRFGFDGGGCSVFLQIGDINSYILCRVG